MELDVAQCHVAAVAAVLEESPEGEPHCENEYIVFLAELGKGIQSFVPLTVRRWLNGPYTKLQYSTH